MPRSPKKPLPPAPKSKARPSHTADAALPEVFRRWFRARGWTARAHQIDLVTAAQAGRSVLLIAPTGAGKTLAGFLPTLIELSGGRAKRGAGSKQGSSSAAGASPPPTSVPHPDSVPPPQPSPASGRGSKPARDVGKGQTVSADITADPTDTAPLPFARWQATQPASPLHTLYISPLKALAVDIARNLETPISEMGLPIRVETRTGDTPSSRRQRQRRDPPDILLTTPEQISLLLASKDAEHLFSGLKRVVLDELHALVTSKRGDLLALALARLRAIAPGLQCVGLSATVAEPDDLRRYLVAQDEGAPAPLADLVVAQGGVAPDVRMLETDVPMPWASHMALHAVRDIYALLKVNRLSLVFVNTRRQAEFIFQELWRINDDNLPIALHHGSLAVEQRRKVEAAMAAGRLKAVVATSSLDLGIDWGDVDLVINVGAPKGSSRLLQRIGRANHRLDEPSRAVLVPANRFEVLECRAALEAVAIGAQDTPPERLGALDVLAQHILGMACAAPFAADALFKEVRSAAPYRTLPREDFDAALEFVATGGYALKAYERYAKIRPTRDGLWRVANPMIAQAYRLNVGTIVESTMLKVRLVSARGAAKTGVTGRVRFGGRMLGEVEEYFVETMVPGDTFVFAGEILRYETLVEDEVYVSRTTATEPKVPAYAGGKFPLSTFLAAGVRALLAAPERWAALPKQVREWLELQRLRSRLPGRDDLLVESFVQGGRHYLVTYPFEGRLAHQTLGMLLTRRLERARLKPLGFVANDYALAVYAAGDMGAAISQGRLTLADLFDEDMLGDDLEAWLAESALMKRTFRYCAVIAGLIERRFPGKEKTSRQVTVSTDLIYDVLRRHESDHLLLRAARADAATGLLDVKRLAQMLARIRGRIVHMALERVSPLAVPVLLEIGQESVGGEASEALLAEAEEELIRAATG
ncbi:ligase-associated DNA damage response DEXH box helicase [Xanthobacter oligotrophicus]|nr:ligase-associated DNA damage response DEXH box helicase [Xanthobacter oligotrophicus]MCG5237022.1 ligase-associated DNA damage response DEXH box helicase [Xanthobacter oligotrophicus]